MSMGADRKANTRGGGALERGHGAALEPLAELGDALGSVGPVADRSRPQSSLLAKLPREGGVSMGADRKANYRGGGALPGGGSASP